MRHSSDADPVTEEGQPLRVLLNASALPEKPAGAGIYTLQPAAALAQRTDVELTVATPRPLGLGCAEIASPAAGPFARSRWEQQALPGMLRDFDVYHGAHFSTPLRSPVPAVATIHDLTFFRLKRRYPLRHRTYYRLLAESTRRATRVIVPSRGVAEDVVRYLHRDRSTIDVVYQAPRAGFQPVDRERVAELLAEMGIEEPYVLCVGTAEPGKRAIDAVRAVAILHERDTDVWVVLAGNTGPLSGPLTYQAGVLGVSDLLRFTGYVDDATLRTLYSGALALAFLPLFEGFGLPPVEAMACGTPVIATDVPAMNEVLDGAAMLVPLRSPAAIADRVEALLADDVVRAEWSRRGRQHVERFRWERAAAETVDVYRSAVWG